MRRLRQPSGDGSRHALVTGRVVRVRARLDGGWRIRLAETGGALAAAEIRLSNPVPLPRVGSYIQLRGALRYDEQHAWYAIDPVEAWVEPHDA
jgi:hypothetical protein